MTIALWIVSVLCLIFAGLAAFCVNELKLKFGFLDKWASQGGQVVEFHNSGSEKSGPEPGMRNIVLRGKRPFAALVCFRFDVFGPDWGIDPYGVVMSDENGVAVISTFFGKGKADFIFVLSTPLETNPVQASSTDEDQKLTPTEIYPPHAVQRWGIVGG